MYDLVIEKYVERYDIKKDEKNINTEILQDIVKNKNMTQENIEFLKKSKILQDIEYSKIELTEDLKDIPEKNEMNIKNENLKKNDKDSKNKKFYF